LQKWIDEITQKKISDRDMKLLEKGFNMGQPGFKSREELYER